MPETTDLLRLELIGAPGRIETAPGSPASERGILGVDVRGMGIDGEAHTAVQVEQQAGEPTLRGVLVLPGGELPPHYVRLAFLPVDVSGTAGTTLAVVRTDVPDLVMAVDDALERGEVTDAQHRALLTSIEQRHP